MRALVLLDDDVSDHRVIDIVLCAGAVVLIAGFVLAPYLSFLFFRLATDYCSTLVTTGVNSIKICWVGCVIDLV